MNYLVEHLLKDVLKALNRQIDLRIRSNSTYHQEDIFNIILMASVNTTSIESTIDEIKDIKGKNDILSPDVIFYHIEKQGYFRLLCQSDRVVNSSHQLAAKSRLFGKYAAVAIDIHEIPYYGEVNNSLIMGCKHNRGTSYCYKYATIDVVEKNQRFTLKAIPLTPLSKNEDIVNELLKHALKYVQIRYVLLDRGFFSIKIMRVFEALKIKYIMPVPKNDRIKEIIKDNLNKKRYFMKYSMGRKKNKITFNLMVKYSEKDNEYHPFATNFDIRDEKDIDLIAELYRKRWGIETGYRVKKDFLAKTTTQRYTLRMLYFMISVILYNFWLLCNMIYCRENGIELGSQKITTRIMKLLITMHLSDILGNSPITDPPENRNSVSY